MNMILTCLIIYYGTFMWISGPEVEISITENNMTCEAYMALKILAKQHNQYDFEVTQTSFRKYITLKFTEINSTELNQFVSFSTI